MNIYSHILRAKALRLSPDQTTELAEMLHILGDANRLSILLVCVDEERAVGAIAEELSLTPSLVSHHLRLLRAARLVRARRQGKQVFYVAADDHVRSVIGDLVAHVGEVGEMDHAHGDHRGSRG
jgi:DNA-binding transcriptional ArsR family regulator